jgi:hypothetical protein
VTFHVKGVQYVRILVMNQILLSGTWDILINSVRMRVLSCSNTLPLFEMDIDSCLE